MTAHHTNSQEGFTLLETLIAFMILAGAMAISAQSIALITKSVSISKERAEVLEVAKFVRLTIVPNVLSNGNETNGVRLNYTWNVKRHTLSSKLLYETAAFVVVTVSSPLGHQHRFAYFGSHSADTR
jgi:Tfp pilus assembly protein PilV